MRISLIAVLLLELLPVNEAAAVAQRSSGTPLRSAPIMQAPMAAPSLLPGGNLAAPAALPFTGAGVPAVAAAGAAQSSLGAAPASAAAPLEGLRNLGQALAQSSDTGGGQAQRQELAEAFEHSLSRPEGVSEVAAEGRTSGGAESLKPAAPAGVASHAEPPSPGNSSKRWSWRATARAAIPHLITGLNMASGLGAALLASQGALLPAGGLILLANIFDSLDGRSARLLGVSSPIGAELDSLADVVSFGAAPALLIYKAALVPLGFGGFAVATAFAGAGMFRLARFNLGVYAERAATAPKDHPDFFTGLPIPGGAGVLVALTLALPAIPAAWAAGVAVVGTLVAAAAMASTLPYPAFKKGGKPLVAALGIGAAMAASLALLGLWSWILAVIFGAYLTTGPLIWLYQRGSDEFKKEFKRKAFHQLLILYVPAYLLLGYPRSAWLFAGWAALIGLIEGLRLKAAWAWPVFESMFGLLILSMPAYLLLGYPMSYWLLAGWTAMIGAIEGLRLNPVWARSTLDSLFGGIIRSQEAFRPSGSFYGALGIATTVALFGGSPAIVIASIATLTWGDAISPLVGMMWGAGSFSVAGAKRSVAGVLAGFAVAAAVALAAGFSPLVALGAALAFSLVDVYPVKPDDNFWIPVVVAAALFILSLL